MKRALRYETWCRNLRHQVGADDARKLEALEKSVATLDINSRRQIEEVYKAIRALMMSTAIKSRPMGITADLDRDR